MKALVTGSHGFIGKNLVNALSMYSDVVCLDIKIGKDLYRAWPKVDIIYHLACVNQEEALTKATENLRVNAEGALFAAKQAKLQGVPLIYTSTASVYGPSRTIPTPVDADIDPRTDYAIAKLAGEYFVKNSGCDYKILRLSNVYGPYQTTDNPYCGVIGKFIEQALNNQPLTVVEPGTQTRDYTYIDDVIDVLITTEIDNTTKNVSSGTETSVLDIVMALADVLNKPLIARFVPERGIDSIKRRRLITDYRCETPFLTGLESTVEWYRESSGKTSPGRASKDRPKALSR